jgi:hypothetical protein
MGSIDHIGGGLYITDIDTLMVRNTSRYDAIVSVCQDTCRDNVSDDVPYGHVELADDRHSVERWGGSCSFSTFSEAVRTAREMWAEHDHLVVHCHAGKNRSGAVCATVWADYHHMDFFPALYDVQRARDIVDPDPMLCDYGQRWLADTDR